MEVYCIGGDQSKLINLVPSPPQSRELKLGGSDACMTGDGRFLLFSQDGVVQKFDLTSPKFESASSVVPACFSHDVPVGSICTGDNGSFALAAYHDGLCRLVNTSTDSVVWQLLLKNIKGSPITVALNSTSQYAAVGTNAGCIAILDCTSQEMHHIFTSEDMKTVKRVAFANSSKSLLGSVSDDGYFRLWDFITRKLVKAVKVHHGSCRDLAFTTAKMGKIAVVVCSDKTVKIVDTSDFSVKCSIKESAPLSCVSFHSDGRHISVGTSDGNILLYDLKKSLQNPLKRLAVFHKSEVKRIIFKLPLQTESRKSTSRSCVAAIKALEADRSGNGVEVTCYESPSIRSETPSNKENRPLISSSATASTNAFYSPADPVFRGGETSSINHQTATKDFSFDSLLKSASSATGKSPIPIYTSTVKTAHNSIKLNSDKHEVSIEDSILYPIDGSGTEEPRSHSIMQGDRTTKLSSLSIIDECNPTSARYAMSDGERHRGKITADLSARAVSPALHPNNLTKKFVHFDESRVIPAVDQTSQSTRFTSPLILLNQQVPHAGAAINNEIGREESLATNNIPAEFLRNAIEDVLEDRMDSLRSTMWQFFSSILYEFQALETKVTQVMSCLDAVNESVMDENEQLKAENEELKRLLSHRKFL